MSRRLAAGLLALMLLAGCADGQAPVMGQAAFAAVTLESSDGRTLPIRDLQGKPTPPLFGFPVRDSRAVGKGGGLGGRPGRT